MVETDDHRPSKIVLIAPDSFKGTASATEVAHAIAAGWASVCPKDELRLMPMADGGEGTLEAFEIVYPGARRMPVTVQGPDNRAVETYWLLLPDGTGVVELANTSGITLLDILSPLDAHSLGFGQAIASSLDHGVKRLLLAVGGSSSSDGGLGTLTALGAAFFDKYGDRVPLGNRGLDAVATVDMSGLRSLPPLGATVLSDVTNPLLGLNGAAMVFGPQKGADTAQLLVLEANLARFAHLLPVDGATPGAGAAGGVAFGLMGWGANSALGSEAVGVALGIPKAIREASIVVTGEGRYDAQSAAGKVPSYLASLAAEAGTSVMLVAGLIEADPSMFVAVESLTELAGSSNAAIDHPLVWLESAGARLAASSSSNPFM